MIGLRYENDRLGVVGRSLPLRIAFYPNQRPVLYHAANPTSRLTLLLAKSIMSQLLPPTEYMQGHYLHDFEVFGSTSMCGFSMGDALDGRKRAAIHGLAEFTLVQFGLNLLNQATFAHAPAHAFAWKRFSPPFSDTHGCFSGHGMGSHIPHSILRFVREPFCGRGETRGITLAWSGIEAYDQYFLVELLRQFMATDAGADFPLEQFYTALGRDYDCTACCLTSEGWQTRHVMQTIRIETND